MQNWSRITRRLRISSVLSHDKKIHARKMWFSNCVFAYVDDLYGLTEKIGARAHILADSLRFAGHLLLGSNSWSLSKAKEDGFCATMHKFTGLLICTNSMPEPTVSFDSARLGKVPTLLDYFTPSMTSHELGKIQTVFGNLVWITKLCGLPRCTAS